MNTEISLFGAAELNSTDWRRIQTVARHALLDLSVRPDAEIDHFLHWDDPNRYMTGHIFPNTEVGKRYREGNKYWGAKVAVATIEDIIVGFVYSAQNVSGSNWLERSLKRHKPNPSNRYLWLGGAAVMPAYQRNGIGTDLLVATLKEAEPDQPVTTYTVPSESPDLTAKLREVGFTNIGVTSVRPYGLDSRPVWQAGLRAPHASDLLENLVN